MSVIKRKLAWQALAVLPCLGLGLLLAQSPAWAQTASEGTAPTVQVSETGGLGEYLTDSEGRTLYFFAADSRGVSNCRDFCANTFPAYTVQGRPTAGDGVVSSRIGTLARENGETQVTYAGHPLYYYVGDMNPGSTAGDGAKKYGAEWSAIGPDGDAAEASAVAKADTGGTESQGGETKTKAPAGSAATAEAKPKTQAESSKSTVQAESTKSAEPKSTAQGKSDGGNPFAGDPKAVAAGKELYSTYGCYGCHGRGGGGGMGPSLIDATWNYGGGSDAALFKTITQGRPKGMPAFGSYFSEEQVWKIVAFLRSISNAPGGAQ